MDEAGRLEIADHVGRLGHELIRFAELARARLNAMQDYSDVPTLALQDGWPALQDGWPIYMAEEEPRAGSLRLPRPNRGKRGTAQPPRLPKVPSEDVATAALILDQEIPEIPEPPSSPGGMRPWKDPDLWTPDAGKQGVPSVRSLPSVPRSEEISEASPDAELGVPKSAPRRFLPTPSLSQTEELPEPPQSPDAELGVPKSAPRRFLPTPSLRSQTEEPPEPPQSPDAELGVPKSAPRRFLPTPSLRSQTKELQAGAHVPEPGTPEPPWSPEERSPQLRRRLFEEEAPEPPLAPEVGHDTDALRFPAGLNGWHDRRSHANGNAAGAVADSEPSSEVTGPQHGQCPDTGRPHGRLARSNKEKAPRKRRGSSRYQTHVMTQAAVALGRLQEEVSALRERMVAMEAPCAAPVAERTHLSEMSERCASTGGLQSKESHGNSCTLPEPPEAPQDEALEVDQKHLAVPQVVPVPDQGAPLPSARSRSPSLDSLDYWAELNQVEHPGSAVTAREAPKQGASLNASGDSGASTGSVPAEMTRAEPPKVAAKEVPTPQALQAEEAVEVKVALKQALSYWLQVDSIFGLDSDTSSKNGEVTYEVQGYWLSHMTSVVRLSSAPKHNRSECRVRNQVVLPNASGSKLAVEVVQKTPDVLYIGRVELDASKTSVHQVDSYELLPSNARIRLRICPHRASVSSVSRGAVVSQPQTPTPRGSLQSVASSKALPVEDRTAGQSTATSAVTPATVRPAATSAAAVEAESETEEGEEEELTEDDPMVP